MSSIPPLGFGERASDIAREADRTRHLWDLSYKDNNIILVIIMLDGTGSMQTYMNICQSHAVRMGKGIKKNNPSCQVLFAFIVYRDPISASSDRHLKISLTPEMWKFERLLQRAVAQGGGDYAEDVNGALQWLNSILHNHSTSADMKRTSVIVYHITDAPGHGFCVHPDVSENEYHEHDRHNTEIERQKMRDEITQLGAYKQQVRCMSYQLIGHYHGIIRITVRICQRS